VGGPGHGGLCWGGRGSGDLTESRLFILSPALASLFVVAAHPIPTRRPISHHHHPPGPSTPKRSPKPNRRRPPRSGHPHGAANALALRHQVIGQAVAANLARRKGHPRVDMEQIAMVGIILAARRYTPERGGFRPFARRYANGEVHHFLRDQGQQ